MINEALAEEVRRGEQRKRRSDGNHSSSARNRISSTRTNGRIGSAGIERRTLEPDPNPKRRMLMKSASSTASGSGQQREKRPIPD